LIQIRVDRAAEKAVTLQLQQETREAQQQAKTVKQARKNQKQHNQANINRQIEEDIDLIVENSDRATSRRGRNITLPERFRD
jgi:hypothetical protein